MVTKAKTKAKAIKKASSRSATRGKLVHLKAKPAKTASRNGTRNATRNGSKPRVKTAVRRQISKSARMEPVRTRVTPQSASGSSTSSDRLRSRHFASAVQAYEAAIKLMHAEQFEKAIRAFEDLVAEHVEEPEIQERAKVLIHACE